MRKNVIDLTGMRFEKLLVVGPASRRGKDGRLLWDCRCDCGNAIMVIGKNLRYGTTKSCGCLRTTMSVRDLTGMRFGRFTVLARCDRISASGHVLWECRCDCGTRSHIVQSNSLRSGKSQSCGCLRTEISRERQKQRREEKEHNVVTQGEKL